MLHQQSLCNLMTEKLSSLFFYLTFWESFLLFTSWLKVRRINCGGGTDIFNFFHRKWRKMWVFPPSQGNNSLPFHLLENMLPLFRKAQVSMESHKQRDHLGWTAGRIRTRVGRVSLSNFRLPCPDALTDPQN